MLLREVGILSSARYSAFHATVTPLPAAPPRQGLESPTPALFGTVRAFCQARRRLSMYIPIGILLLIIILLVILF